jgi:hypothetical protein
VNVLFQHLESDVQPLQEIAPEVPGWLADVVMRCMSRLAADRPATAAETLALLRRAAA